MRNNQTPQQKAQQQDDYASMAFLVLLTGLFGCLVFQIVSTLQKIELVSMDFSADMNSDSTMQSARWDLLISVPRKFCQQGNLEASFLYKNVTLVTSPIQSYDILELGMPKRLNVSAVASEKDLSGAIGKEILEAIKERNEVRFGSRLYFRDCREDPKQSAMSYDCDEITLRFGQIKATSFEKKPYSHH